MECPKCKFPLAGVSVGRDAWGGGDTCPWCQADLSGLTDEDAPQGEIIGWRGVAVRDVKGRPRIFSPQVARLRWDPGETMVATCHGVPLDQCPHRLAGDKAPMTTCSCGFYAARTRDHLLGLGYNRYSTPDDPDHVLCEVAQWGRVVIASNGFRAEKVKLVRIYVPSDGIAWKRAALLKEDYGPFGVEVVMADTLNLPKGIIPKWCAACGAQMTRKDSLECEFCGHYNQPAQG